jgi:hypothetical protein
MRINQLGRWGVALLAPVWVQIQVAQTPMPMPMPMPMQEVFGSDASRPSSYGLRVELDFNTSAEWTQGLTPTEAQDLTEELRQLAVKYVGTRIR